MKASPMQVALQNCSLHALLIVTSKALTHAGFGDVQIMGRRRTTQRTRLGGFEMLCEMYVNAKPIRVVVKVIRDDIRVRMLDELTGVLLRTHADFGLIVTPFGVTGRASRIVADYKPARLEIIEGRALEELVTRFGIGVRGNGLVDYAYFGQLEEAAQHIQAFYQEHR